MFCCSTVILQYAQYEAQNPYEFYFLRMSFSISTSWMLLETVVSIFYVIKAAYYYNPQTEVERTPEEATYTVYTLWFLFVVYNVYAYIEFNPLFGFVFIWALMGIRFRNKDNIEFERIYKHSNRILKVYAVAWIG